MKFKCLNLSIQSNTQVSKELIKLLKIPIDLFSNILVLLKLKHYSILYDHLDFVGRKSICQYLLNKALENETVVGKPEDVEALLQLVNPLVVDTPDKPADYEQDNEDFVDEQTLLARLIHLMHSNDLNEQFTVIPISIIPPKFILEFYFSKILVTARKQFANSGKERMRYVLPPLVFKAYDLSYRYKQADDVENNWERIFKFCFQTINALIKAELPAELAFRLFLQGAITLCEIGNENSLNITYEFISQAISLYDEEIATNKLSAITLIIGTCQNILHMFNSEECDSLRQDCAIRAAKLLKKPDQCRAVALCSNLFWHCKPRKNGSSVSPHCQSKSNC